jgi:hypothetical protein
VWTGRPTIALSIKALVLMPTTPAEWKMESKYSRRASGAETL